MPSLRVVFAALCLAGVSACGGGTAGDVPGRVTFNEHVAPIVFEHCAPCHRPGEVAPFPLLSYADVTAEATAIGRETLERHMPT